MGRVFRRTYRDKATGEVATSDRYTIEFYDGHGRKFREPAETSNKERAQALLRKREQEVWEGRFFPTRKRRVDKTIGDLRDRWLEDKAGKRSLRHDRARLGAFVDHLGKHRLISTITTDDVIEWRKVLVKKGLAVATVNRHLAALRGALNYARDVLGWTHRDPMKGIEHEPERNARNRICSQDEYSRLIEAAEPTLRLVVIVGYWNGMRLGEIIGLERRHIDIKALTIRLASRATKESDVKTVPLPPEAAPVLEVLPTRIDGRLFDGTSDDYSARFAALCVEAGVDGLHFHDLRHTAVTNMINAGIDLHTIQSITGHKTLHMTKRYAHISDARRRDAMDRVRAMHHSTSGTAGTKDRS